MNSNSQLARDPQAPLPTGPIGLPKQRPAGAQLREALTALHVGGMCLAAWGEGALDAADKAVEQAAADAAGLARDRVRVRTGDLQRSIASQRISWGLAVVEAGDGLGYARTVESHTGFFNRAVDQVQQELRERVSAAMGKALFS